MRGQSRILQMMFRRRRSLTRGGVLVELAIVVPLLLVPIAAIVIDYTLALQDYDLMMRAIGAGQRAAVEYFARKDEMFNEITADEVFDAAENAIKDYLNNCNHAIAGDCDPAIRRDKNYKIEMREQDISFYSVYTLGAEGLKISMTRARPLSFLGGRLAQTCASAVVRLPVHPNMIMPRTFRCQDQRITNPLNESPYRENPCGCRVHVGKSDPCAESPCAGGGCIVEGAPEE